MKEGWEYKKLGEVCEILNGFAFKSSNYVPEGVRVIRITNVQKGYVEDNDPKYYPYETKDELSRYLLKEGDMLLSLTGNVGRVAILEKSYLPAYLNQRVACIRVRKGVELNLSFLFHLLYSQKFEDDCIKSSNGAAQLNMSTVWLASYLIPVPTLSEQQSIVDYLDAAFAKIDAMKANAEKALNEAKALFQASLKEMLEPKEGWKNRTLQEVACDFSRGKSKHRPRNDKKLFGGSFPFIQTGEIRNSNVYVTSHSATYNELGLSQSKLWPENTICITIAANIAEVAILKYPSCFPDSVIGFVADKNKVDKMFVFYSLLNYQQELKKQGKGSAQDNINLGTFEKNKFPFPSLQEQQRIADALDSLKSKVDRLQENYDKISQECDALKQAILRQVFE